jgi:hypothetical protein
MEKEFTVTDGSAMPENLKNGDVTFVIELQERDYRY